MPRQNLNLDVKIGGRKRKVRKRGSSSSSSSSSLYRNCRLKRVFSTGRRIGPSTPVPKWKMTSSKSPSVPAKGLPVSARKLAATLWEIDGLPSMGLKSEKWCEKINGVVGDDRREKDLECWKLGSRALVLSDLPHSPVSERMELQEVGSHRRRTSAGSQKILQAGCNLGGAKSVDDCLVEVDQTQNHGSSPYRNLIRSKNRLEDVYNGLITSKEVLKVMSRTTHFDQHNSTSLSLFTALKCELDRACAHVTKLIREQGTDRSDIDVLLKRFEEEKIIWKLKEQDRIRYAITSIAGELDTERKLRRQSERVNKKLGRELLETKASLVKINKELESERRAREVLEQVCDELARGMGEDRAEAEELKRQSAKVCEEVEREREMLQVADILREERVKMKLSEAKYHFEEKNAVLDKLRDELEVYLKSKRGEEQESGSPSYGKIKELEKYLRETLPCWYENRSQEKSEIGLVNNNEEEGDSGDSDLHSIELNVDDDSKCFRWSDAMKTEKKRNSVEKSRRMGRRVFPSEPGLGDGVEWENLDVFEKRGVFEFASHPWKKKDIEDEIERYNMIKDLRDHIVSCSKMDDTGSPTRREVGRKDVNGVVR